MGSINRYGSFGLRSNMLRAATPPMLTKGSGRVQLLAENLVSQPVLLLDVPSAATKEFAPRNLPFPMAIPMFHVAADLWANTLSFSHLRNQCLESPFGGLVCRSDGNWRASQPAIPILPFRRAPRIAVGASRRACGCPEASSRNLC